MQCSTVEGRLDPLVAFPFWLDPRCQPNKETPSRFLLFYLSITIPRPFTSLLPSCPCFLPLGSFTSQDSVLRHLDSCAGSTAIKAHVTTPSLEDGFGSCLGTAEHFHSIRSPFFTSPFNNPDATPASKAPGLSEHAGDRLETAWSPVLDAVGGSAVSL